RIDWDLATAGRAARDGAIFGVATGGTLLAGRRFAPHLMERPAGSLATAGVAALGGAGASGLLDGHLPTGTDLLLALSSGLAGGVELPGSGAELAGARSAHAGPGAEL